MTAIDHEISVSNSIDPKIKKKSVYNVNLLWNVIYMKLPNYGK